MEKLNVSWIIGVAVASIILLCGWAYRRIKRAPEIEFDPSDLVHHWHVTAARNNNSFYEWGTRDEVIEKLRVRVPGATITHIDEEWHVILFDFPK